MKKQLLVPGLVALAALTTAATIDEPTATKPAAWSVDGAHTEINFSVRHFFTPVTGTFDRWEANLEFDAESPENSRVEVQIEVASVNTGNEKRDNHLRSGDWFEADLYPHITFESTSVRKTAEGRFVARGNLTIKDVSQEVELDIDMLGIKDIPEQMREMLGGVSQVASFAASTEIDRRDYGVGVGGWAETVIVGSGVEISIALEANRKPTVTAASN